MNWLSELFNKATCWIPRIVLIAPDEDGVRVTLGKYQCPTPPGWYLFFPLVQKITYVTVTPQVEDLRAQSIMTSDGFSMAVSGAVEYSIRDPIKALFNVQDFDKSLKNLSLGAVLDYVTTHTLEQCKNVEEIKGVVRKALREHVNDWGIKLINVYITDLDKHRAIRLLGVNDND
jgi:regulator of protease activity HflC (stomatin/prohibitin superfamily)